MRSRSLYRSSLSLHQSSQQQAQQSTYKGAMPFSYSAAASSLGSRARSAMQAASSYVVAATSDESSERSESDSTPGTPREGGQSWIGSAREWRNRKPPGMEKLTIVPGWAVKTRRAKGQQTRGDDQAVEPFDVHVLVSGFALLERNIEHASRTQRVVMRMARSLAALPDLPETDDSLFEQFDDPKALDKDTRKTEALLEHPFSFENMSKVSIEAAHANMNARLHPFWSSSLPGRPIRLTLRTEGGDAQDHLPLATYNFVTDLQGHFSKRFILTWEQLCTDPPTVAKAFAGAGSFEPWTLQIDAELLPQRSLMSQDTAECSQTAIVKQTLSTPVTPTSGLRVICDLDDTVKRTDVLSGLRTVIRNVFCAPLEGACVAGIDDLFRVLADKGVHFHFVSNSPIELYDVIASFLRVHRFPSHASVRLKNYGQGRALFTSLVEAAGGRKKPSVAEAMDAFPDASFLLIGDSGEEDLELYTEIARERTNQVAGIYIRDVSSSGASIPTEALVESERYKPRRQQSTSSVSSMEETEAQLSELSDAEQKILERAANWSQRQAKARLEIPEEIPLRIFHSVEEVAPEILQAAERLSEKSQTL